MLTRDNGQCLHAYRGDFKGFFDTPTSKIATLIDRQIESMATAHPEKQLVSYILRLTITYLTHESLELHCTKWRSGKLRICA
jgi:hypothetical protein